MHARFIVIAATLLSTSAMAADTSKPAPQPPVQPEPAAPKIVLASAEVTPASAPTTQQAEPAKPKRHGRVTGCRCGDQEAQPDDE